MGRVVVPNYPHHVVQRGHNRQVVFATDTDCRRYLENLRELKDAFGIRIHAYCLMTNHVHLLLTPGDEVAALGQLMKALAARTTRYRNRLEGRSGTLWESRYRSSPVQTDRYQKEKGDGSIFSTDRKPGYGRPRKTGSSRNGNSARSQK